MLRATRPLAYRQDLTEACRRPARKTVVHHAVQAYDAGEIAKQTVNADV